MDIKELQYAVNVFTKATSRDLGYKITDSHILLYKEDGTKDLVECKTIREAECFIDGYENGYDEGYSYGYNIGYKYCNAVRDRAQAIKDVDGKTFEVGPKLTDAQAEDLKASLPKPKTNRKPYKVETQMKIFGVNAETVLVDVARGCSIKSLAKTLEVYPATLKAWVERQK